MRTKLTRNGYNIYNILNNSGRHDIWARQPINVNFSLCKSIRENLHNKFLKKWNSLIQETSKGRNYILFKLNLQPEKYINISNDTLLLSMFRFRNANHKLLVETDRWKYTEFSERICQLCG